jgi:Uma2 family endonuclease
MEKMPFYAKLGVPEMWIIDRDTKVPELYVLREGEYQPQSPDAHGWLESAATGIRVRAEPHDKLSMQLGEDEGTKQALPEDR